MADKARVFVGFDSKEVVAYHVFCQSILEKSSIPVEFLPVSLSTLGSVFTRERNQLQSTEFSFSRFLVPYLSNFEGWSLFADCDMLMRTDIATLWDLRDDRYAAMCVKHDYTPKIETKFLGQTQTKYEKKNWSSVMLFNCAKCTALTPDYVNSATGLELHQFKWLDDDRLIGEIPRRWNHLAGYDPFENDVSIVHYTIGGPFYDEFKDCSYSTEWFAEREEMLHCDQSRAKKPAKTGT